MNAFYTDMIWREICILQNFKLDRALSQCWDCQLYVLQENFETQFSLCNQWLIYLGFKLIIVLRMFLWGTDTHYYNYCTYSKSIIKFVMYDLLHYIKKQKPVSSILLDIYIYMQFSIVNWIHSHFIIFYNW